MPKRGRPGLDPAAGEHSPRIAIRMPGRVRDRVVRRAAEQGTSVSEVIRMAVESLLDEGGPAEREELRRLVRLTDREREQLFLASNANVRRLIARGGE